MLRGLSFNDIPVSEVLKCSLQFLIFKKRNEIVDIPPKGIVPFKEKSQRNFT